MSFLETAFPGKRNRKFCGGDEKFLNRVIDAIRLRIVAFESFCSNVDPQKNFWMFVLMFDTVRCGSYAFQPNGEW